MSKILVVGSDENPLASDPTLLESQVVRTEFLEALAHIALQTKPGDIPDPEMAVSATDAAADGEGEAAGADAGADVVSDEAADIVALDAYGLKPKQLYEHLSAMIDKLNFDVVGDGTNMTAEVAATAPRRPSLRPPRQFIGVLGV